jgi:phosphorylase kinase alpha/beta subunit
MPPIVVQNEKLLPYLTDQYDLTRLRRLRRFLERHGTLKLAPLRTHLFPAAVVTRSTSQSGYHHVWVRDNVHVSHALYVAGHMRAAAQIMSALMEFFARHRRRFEDIIDGRVTGADPMSRPHVRFNGVTLEESRETWAHAQNDALGIFLWMYCTLACEGILKPSGDERKTLTLFPRYFEAIRYWVDEDSGHWEEGRKIGASSIGMVVGGLGKLRQFLSEERSKAVPRGQSPGISDSFLNALMRRDRNELRKILPHECIQKSPAKRRRTDAALLFLVYPLEVVGEVMSGRILRDIAKSLEGPFGIKRYIGDSYWAADYKVKLDSTQRTADFSDRVEMRNTLLAPGQEAQWCLFDPIMSAAYGRRYHRTGRRGYLNLQTYYLNRSLGQLTGKVKGMQELQCPEAYYLERGIYVPNEQTPLLWTQANLLVALTLMEESLSA